jgi:CRP-like cAMP-binding protein
MEEPIKTYLNSVKSICPQLTDKELNYIESGLTISELKNREEYIKQNCIQKEIGFVYSGLLRGFYVDDFGNQITIKFIKENEFVTDFSGFINQNPSKYSFQSIEPSVLVNISYNHLFEGFDNYPILERYFRLISEEVIIYQQSRIESFLLESAEERYLRFLKESPDLYKRVSLTYLCTYLGVERQTLTRIRKKLSNSLF